MIINLYRKKNIFFQNIRIIITRKKKMRRKKLIKKNKRFIDAKKR